MFSAEDPRRTLADLIVPDDVRTSIDGALSLLRSHKTLFITWNLAKIAPYHQGTAINLYGPSGTGKSMCAEAIAHAVGRPVINVKSGSTCRTTPPGGGCGHLYCPTSCPSPTTLTSPCWPASPRAWRAGTW
jgi:hypothetical protein